MRALVVAWCLLVATAAHADDRAHAKQLYDEGLRHYNVAEYPEAIAAWKQAYLIAKKPILLFNIAQAYRLAGDCKQALTFYDSYEREEPHPKNQDELDQALALCKDAKDATPITPDKPPPVADKPPPVPDQPVPPPDTSVARAPEPARVEPVANPKRRTAIVVGGVGVAFGITGIVFALDARAQQGKVANVTSWTQTDNDIQTRGVRDNRLAVVCGGLGVAGIATGVVLYMVGRGNAEHGLAIAPSRGGATVAWHTAF